MPIHIERARLHFGVGDTEQSAGLEEFLLNLTEHCQVSRRNSIAEIHRAGKIMEKDINDSFEAQGQAVMGESQKSLSSVGLLSSLVVRLEYGQFLQEVPPAPRLRPADWVYKHQVGVQTSPRQGRSSEQSEYSEEEEEEEEERQDHSHEPFSPPRHQEASRSSSGRPPAAPVSQPAPAAQAPEAAQATSSPKMPPAPVPADQMPEIVRSIDRPLPSVRSRVQQLEEATATTRDARGRQPLRPPVGGLGRSSFGQLQVPTPRHGPHMQDVVAPPPPKAPSRKASPAPRPQEIQAHFVDYQDSHEAPRSRRMSPAGSNEPLSPQSPPGAAPSSQEEIANQAPQATPQLPHLLCRPGRIASELAASEEAKPDSPERCRKESHSGSEADSCRRGQSAVVCGSDRKVSEPGRSDSSVDMAALEAPGPKGGSSSPGSLQERIKHQLDKELSSHSPSEVEDAEALQAAPEVDDSPYALQEALGQKAEDIPSDAAVADFLLQMHEQTGKGQTSRSSSEVPTPRHGPHMQDVIAPPAPTASSREASPAPRPQEIQAHFVDYQGPHEAPCSRRMSPAGSNEPLSPQSPPGAVPSSQEDIANQAAPQLPHLLCRPGCIAPELAASEAKPDSPERCRKESHSGSEVDSCRNGQSAVVCGSDRKVSEPGRSDSSVDMIKHQLDKELSSHSPSEVEDAEALEAPEAALEAPEPQGGSSSPGSLQDGIKHQLDKELSSHSPSEVEDAEALEAPEAALEAPEPQGGSSSPGSLQDGIKPQLDKELSSHSPSEVEDAEALGTAEAALEAPEPQGGSSSPGSLQDGIKHQLDKELSSHSPSEAEEPEQQEAETEEQAKAVAETQESASGCEVPSSFSSFTLNACAMEFVPGATTWKGLSAETKAAPQEVQPAQQDAKQINEETWEKYICDQKQRESLAAQAASHKEATADEETADTLSAPLEAGDLPSDAVLAEQELEGSKAEEAQIEEEEMPAADTAAKGYDGLGAETARLRDEENGLSEYTGSEGELSKATSSCEMQDTSLGEIAEKAEESMEPAKEKAEERGEPAKEQAEDSREGEEQAIENGTTTEKAQAIENGTTTEKAQEMDAPDVLPEEATEGAQREIDDKGTARCEEVAVFDIIGGAWRGESLSPQRRTSSRVWHIMRLQQPLPPPNPEDNWEMSSLGDGEMDEEEHELMLEKLRVDKKVPRWCENYLELVHQQHDWDPDSIFGQVPTCDLEEVIPDSIYEEVGEKRSYLSKRRKSEGDWSRDRLTDDNVEDYKMKLGHTKAWIADVDALSPTQRAMIEGFGGVSRSRGSRDTAASPSNNASD